MTDWKERHRERKEASGLSWDEYVNQRLVHVDDIPESELAAICEHLEAVEREYRELKREIHTVRKLAESEEFDP